jgi:hypothetical protein
MRPELRKIITSVPSRKALASKLRAAAQLGNIDEARQILEHKNVGIDWCDEKGDTALTLATKHGHVDVAKLLLGRGSSILMSVGNRRNAVEIALDVNSASLLEMFIESGQELYTWYGPGGLGLARNTKAPDVMLTCVQGYIEHVKSQRQRASLPSGISHHSVLRVGFFRGLAVFKQNDLAWRFAQEVFEPQDAASFLESFAYHGINAYTRAFWNAIVGLAYREEILKTLTKCWKVNFNSREVNVVLKWLE